MPNVEDFDMAETYELLIQHMSVYGLKVLGAIAILVFGVFAVRLMLSGFRRTMVRARVDEILISFSLNTLKTFAWVFIGISALGQLGFQTTSLAAILGAVGLAIGLAFQSSLSNLAAGIMIIIFRPFKKGHYIDTAGGSGSVEGISIFTTTLKSPDNKTIIVPNSKLTSDSITNYSANKTRRVDMVFGIGYDDDMKKAKAVFEELLAKDKRVLKDPEPVIALGELGDNSVNFYVRPWVKTPDYWQFMWDYTEAVKLRLDKEGISIPYPQTDVHIVNVPDKIKAA